MTFAPTAFDFAIVVALMVATLFELRIFAGLHRTTAFEAFPRMALYVWMTSVIWCGAGCVLALWIRNDRPWSALLVGAVIPWRFVTGMIVAIAYISLLVWQRRRLLMRPERFARLRERFRSVQALLPHTTPERRMWTCVSLSAGCCEELLFRGFLLALLTDFLGLIAAVPLSAVLFGRCHGYQGRSAIAATSGFGFLLTLIALGSGSLVPAMLIHFAQDFANGDIAFRVFTTSDCRSVASANPLGVH